MASGVTAANAVRSEMAVMQPSTTMADSSAIMGDSPAAIMADSSAAIMADSSAAIMADSSAVIELWVLSSAAVMVLGVGLGTTV